MEIRRRILIAVLATGSVLGFASGISGMRMRYEARRAAFEKHVAYTCAEAARHPEAAPKADVPRGW